MKTIINPEKYYYGYRYCVVIPSLVSKDIFYKYFSLLDSATECKNKYLKSEIMRVLPF